MSFKDFFVNTDPKIETKTSVKASTTAIDTMPSGPYKPDSTQLDSKSTDDFNQYLMKIMDDANLPGPDYYEFVKALKALEAIPLTDQQKYITVFAGFQVQGVTPQSLIDAAQKYIVILGQKKSSEFDTSVSSSSVKIDIMEKEVLSLTKENDELTKKLTQNAQKIASLNNEVIEKKQKLEIKKTTFEMSFKNFINKIMSDIDNITKYLINGNAPK